MPSSMFVSSGQRTPDNSSEFVAELESRVCNLDLSLGDLWGGVERDGGKGGAGPRSPGRRLEGSVSKERGIGLVLYHSRCACLGCIEAIVAYLGMITTS
jgi:hypothetical protein